MAKEKMTKKNITPPKTNSAKPSNTPPIIKPKGTKNTPKKGK